ncbi:hypothetical protein MVEN_00870000 [Mycena venus]|uniref:Uncharacterized protein n=1 Tax=Mycena venus TaxID=2733690 RepID=A0A8H7D495_9AGAR|nr:hypothetical protein MVEN_00870000 [Mycena venus]
MKLRAHFRDKRLSHFRIPATAWRDSAGITHPLPTFSIPSSRARQDERTTIKPYTSFFGTPPASRSLPPHPVLRLAAPLPCALQFRVPCCSARFSRQDWTWTVLLFPISLDPPTSPRPRLSHFRIPATPRRDSARITHPLPTFSIPSSRARQDERTITKSYTGFLSTPALYRLIPYLASPSSSLILSLRCPLGSLDPPASPRPQSSLRLLPSPRHTFPQYYRRRKWFQRVKCATDFTARRVRATVSQTVWLVVQGSAESGSGGSVVRIVRNARAAPAGGRS